MTISKVIGAVAAVIGICVISYMAIDYGVLETETGFLAVIAALAGLGGYSVHQVTKK